MLNKTKPPVPTKTEKKSPSGTKDGTALSKLSSEQRLKILSKFFIDHPCKPMKDEPRCHP